jgi:hypothetical protein
MQGAVFTACMHVHACRVHEQQGSAVYLSQPVYPVLCLLLHCRVPPGVHQHHMAAETLEGGGVHTQQLVTLHSDTSQIAPQLLSPLPPPGIHQHHMAAGTVVVVVVVGGWKEAQTHTHVSTIVYL